MQMFPADAPSEQSVFMPETQEIMPAQDMPETDMQAETAQDFAKQASAEPNGNAPAGMEEILREQNQASAPKNPVQPQNKPSLPRRKLTTAFLTLRKCKRNKKNPSKSLKNCRPFPPRTRMPKHRTWWMNFSEMNRNRKALCPATLLTTFWRKWALTVNNKGKQCLSTQRPVSVY